MPGERGRGAAVIAWVVRLASVWLLAFALAASGHWFEQAFYSSAIYGVDTPEAKPGYAAFVCRADKVGNLILLAILTTLVLCFVSRRFLLRERLAAAIGCGLLEFWALVFAGWLVLGLTGGDEAWRGAIEAYTVRACGLGANWR